MLIEFAKYHANGNNFILIFSKNFPEAFRTKQIIKKLCCKNTGISSDGLFIISKSKIYDFKLDYYNNDGTWETLCANGSRCAVAYMYSLNKIKSNTVFETGAGIYSAKVINKMLISMKMNTPQYIKSYTINNLKGWFVDSGAKHLVIHSKNLNHDFCYKNGQLLRYAKEFSPHGININFFNISKNNIIEITTYEKGIENIVQSCASGSTAVVFHLFKKLYIKSPVITKSPGGLLRFEFDRQWKNVWTEGPAELIYIGTNYNIKK